MGKSKVAVPIMTLIAGLFFHSTAFAQRQTYTFDWVFEVSCGSFDVHEVAVNDPPGNWIQSTITVAVYSKTFALDEYGSLENARVEFSAWVEEIACGIGRFDAAAPADPILAQNMQSFKSDVFSERARPRTAGKRTKKIKPTGEVEKGEREGAGGIGQRIRAAVLQPDEMSSDMEYEFFDISGAGGKNLALRGGYGRTSDTGEWSYGGRFFYNGLSFDDGDSFGNSTINLYGNRILLETEEKERSVGGSFNLLLLDNDYSNDNGIALAAYGIERLYRGENITVYGAMLQYTKVGDLSAIYLNLAGMYGFPLGERYSLNIDGLFTRNIRTSFDGEKVDYESSNILNLGATLSIYMSETFGLNVGLKKIFLVKNYSSLEITLGGGFRF